MTPGEALRLILQPTASPEITEVEMAQLDTVAEVAGIEYAAALGFRLRMAKVQSSFDVTVDGNKLTRSQVLEHLERQAIHYEGLAVAQAAATSSGISSVVVRRAL